MSSLAKTLWIATIAAICGLGLLLARQENATREKRQVCSEEAELSLQLIEAELRAVYPGFTTARKIEVGFRRTTNAPSIELFVTDVTGTRYVCSASRSSHGWKIERVWRASTAAIGRLI